MVEFVVILVKPQLAANVGAVCRVACNFNVKEIRIVAPQYVDGEDEIATLSSGAITKIKMQSSYESLASALTDIHTSYAITARQRWLSKEVVYLHNFYKTQNFQDFEKVALVFGPEKSGLENEDVVLCSQILTINTNQHFSSLNISHAVACVCYETTKNYIVEKELEVKSADLATYEEKIFFFQYLKNKLESNDFFKVPEKKIGMISNIINIFNRIHSFSSQDVRTLHGIIRSLCENQKNEKNSLTSAEK